MHLLPAEGSGVQVQPGGSSAGGRTSAANVGPSWTLTWTRRPRPAPVAVDRTPVLRAGEFVVACFFRASRGQSPRSFGI